LWRVPNSSLETVTNVIVTDILQLDVRSTSNALIPVLVALVAPIGIGAVEKVQDVLNYESNGHCNEQEKDDVNGK